MSAPHRIYGKTGRGDAAGKDRRGESGLKDKFLRKVSARFDIPNEILTRDPLIEICGVSKVAIDHHSAILEYTPQRIHVATRTGIVAVQGSGLTITLLTRTRVEIGGRISSVLLE